MDRPSPQHLEEVIEQALRHRLAVVNLSHCALAVVPTSLRQLSDHVQILCLNNNKLLIPPMEITELLALEQLILDNNQLTMLPSGMAQLQRLQALSLSRNPLTLLPPQFGQLQNLSDLWLCDTDIEVLPPEITKLTKLQRLALRGNKLTSIPDEIGHLKHLQWLHLGSNRLMGLPAAVSTLVSLVYLNVDLNQLTAVPKHLAELPQLSTLLMRGNPISELDDDTLLGLSKLQAFDLRDTRIQQRPTHWKGLEYIWLADSEDYLAAHESSERQSPVRLPSAQGTEQEQEEEVEPETGEIIQ